MPGGIVALVLAILASTAVQAGDYNKARSHLVWSYVVSGFSVVLGMLFSMIYCAACLGGA
jgi:NhaP-type Na+/H+ or K+/H+ antiporter